MMDVDFVRKYFEEQSEPFNNACDEKLDKDERVSNAQIQTAEDLRKLQQQFEESQREQAKENRVNRWLTVASLLIAFVSMIAAIVALIR